MFIFLEFRLWCLSSPYQKYRGVCSSCSAYTFFNEVFIANPTINIDIMPLSWAYESPVKGTPDVSIEPGLQNCNRWLRNSIIYSTSCQTDDHIPSTIYNYKIQDTIAKVAYTSMPPPYLHSVSLLSKRFVTSLCQHWNESRCLSRRLSSTTSYRGSQICSQWFWITLTQAFD